jgi:hypothetical protein
MGSENQYLSPKRPKLLKKHALKIVLKSYIFRKIGASLRFLISGHTAWTSYKELDVAG